MRLAPLRAIAAAAPLIVIPARAALAAGQGGAGPPNGNGASLATPLDQVVLYGVDDLTKELVRYPFGAETVQAIGPLGYVDAGLVTSVESLAFIPTGPTKGLYAVDNFNTSVQSRLIKINAFDASVQAVGSTIGFGNIEGLISMFDNVASEWTLLAVQSGNSNGAQADNDTGELHVDWWINGVHAGSLQPSGTFVPAYNWWSYSGQDNDPQNVNLSYNLIAGPDLALVSGSLTMENTGTATADVVVEITMPLGQSWWGGSSFQGSAAVGLTTDASGGTIAPLDGGAGWQAMIDGTAVMDLFAAPWQLHNDGIGSAGDSANFGSPDMIAGPAAAQSIGIRVAFSLTPSDQMSMTSGFHVVGESAPASAQNLIRIDLATGTGSMVMPLGHRFTGLARTTNGHIRATRDNELWALDPQAGTVSLINTHNFNEMQALEVAAGDGTAGVAIPGAPPGWTKHGALLGFSGQGDTMVLFHPNNGNAMAIAAPLEVYDLVGIVFVTLLSDPFGDVIATLGD